MGVSTAAYDAGPDKEHATQLLNNELQDRKSVV